jgi:hypothetical protein
MASAWATLLAYGLMMLVSYWIGRKHYSIPYELFTISAYIVVGSVITFTSHYWLQPNWIQAILILMLFVIIIFVIERKTLRTLF